VLGDVFREGDTWRIEVVRVGANPVPIDIAVTWADDRETELHEPVSVWREGAGSHVIEVPAHGEIRQVVLGNDITPDANPADNRYPPEVP